jgi:uncharacterized protein with PIN domain
MQTKIPPPNINPINFTSNEFSNHCPYCNSLIWVNLHRKWWQKILHPRQHLCLCRTCRKEFWRQSFD